MHAGLTEERSSGGTLGVIPIKYKNYGSAHLNLQHYGLAHPDFTRTGSYYLPPVSTLPTVSCSTCWPP